MTRNWTGLLRRGLQLFVVLYVGLYQLWYAQVNHHHLSPKIFDSFLLKNIWISDFVKSFQGYQEFSSVESSTTTKVKGYSVSRLDHDVAESMKPELRVLYERVWDEADYVVPPAENGAFFVTTNIVITPNQTLGHCPEVFIEKWHVFVLVHDLVFLNEIWKPQKKHKGDISYFHVLALQVPRIWLI